MNKAKVPWDFSFEDEKYQKEPWTLIRLLNM